MFINQNEHQALTVAHKKTSISLTDRQHKILSQIISQKKTEQRIFQRASCILGSAAGESDCALSKSIGLCRSQMRHWRTKWNAHQDSLNALESAEIDTKYKEGIIAILSDGLRPGCPAKFTAEQVCQIVKLSCESPEDHSHSCSHWSSASLKEAVIKQGIVTTISKTQVGRFLK